MPSRPVTFHQSIINRTYKVIKLISIHLAIFLIGFAAFSIFLQHFFLHHRCHSLHMKSKIQPQCAPSPAGGVQEAVPQAPKLRQFRKITPDDLWCHHFSSFSSFFFLISGVTEQRRKGGGRGLRVDDRSGAPVQPGGDWCLIRTTLSSAPYRPPPCCWHGCFLIPQVTHASLGFHTGHAHSPQTNPTPRQPNPYLWRGREGIRMEFFARGCDIKDGSRAKRTDRGRDVWLEILPETPTLTFHLEKERKHKKKQQ